MKGYTIHNKNRLWLWPLAHQRQELLYELLKDDAVCRSPKTLFQNNAVMYICWQNLVSSLTLKADNLDEGHT
jgi:hypothetical protein